MTMLLAAICFLQRPEEEEQLSTKGLWPADKNDTFAHMYLISILVFETLFSNYINTAEFLRTPRNILGKHQMIMKNLIFFFFFYWKNSCF